MRPTDARFITDFVSILLCVAVMKSAIRLNMIGVEEDCDSAVQREVQLLS